MGDPKRDRKKYETPKVPWSIQTLEAELRLLGEYGLRNKRELWRQKTEVSCYRKLARSLLGRPSEERAGAEKALLGKLRREGLVPEGATLDDVLDLTVNDLLERRLQTMVFRRGLAKTIQQARQLIIHGHIALGDRVVRVPSYHVTVEEEGSIGYASLSPLTKEGHPARVSIEAVQSTQKMKEAEAEF